MISSKSLIQLMEEPLPTIAAQKRKCYRPSLRTVTHIYNLLNEQVFANQLVRCPIELGQTRGYWGVCYSHEYETRPGTVCKIRLSNKWFCKQWMITTLAHEMVHQYEADVLGRQMTHRAYFFMWRDALAKHGIDLKTAHRMKKWFRYQEFQRA